MMQKVLRKLLQVCLACALLWSTPRTVQSSQSKSLTCSQANCIYVPVFNRPPYITAGYWAWTNTVNLDYVIYGEVENNSEFLIDNVVINTGTFNVTTNSKFVLPGKFARYVNGFPWPPPAVITKPTVYTWTINSTTPVQLLDVLKITTQQQKDEYGGYSAVTVTLRNNSLKMLREADVQKYGRINFLMSFYAEIVLGVTHKHLSCHRRLLPLQIGGVLSIIFLPSKLILTEYVWPDME